MKRISVVPELINSEEIKIFDANNIPISICQKSPYLFNYNSFKNPFLIIDNFERRKYKQIDIKRIDLQQLKKLGFRVAWIKCTSHTRNFPRQVRTYLLEGLNEAIPNSIVVSAIPKEHYIEQDVINKRVRLHGLNVYPYRPSESSTPWVQVK